MKVSTGIAPGKIIISGEHAVVYGKPALLMAVNSFAKTVVCEQTAPTLSLTLENFNLRHTIPIEQLNSTKEILLNKYQAFLAQQCSIREVFHDPLQLAQFAVIHTLDHLQGSLSNGITMRIHSDLLIGCGMGSSAAVAMSVIQALVHHVAAKLNREEYYKLGCAVEQLQHGHSSGADVYASLEGGAIYFQAGHIETRALPAFTFYLVYTGKPDSTTGDCVSQVAAQFSRDQALWEDFATLTEAIDQDLKNNIDTNLVNHIRENHQLLTYIGVVPAKVQQFITELEQQGAAGKICGAGAITGNAGGIVLVLAESREKLVALCNQYHFSLLDIRGESHGSHAL